MGGLGRMDSRFLLHDALDVLHDDDRVVDDKSDRQDQGEQRHRVRREAEGEQDREDADQRYRDGQSRNERRAPVLQEDEDDASTMTPVSASV